MERTTREEIKKSILRSVEAALDNVDEKYESMNAKATELYDDAKERTSHAYDSVKDKAVESREKTVNYIKGNPEKSVVLAAGIGALVALVVSAIMNRRRD